MARRRASVDLDAHVVDGLSALRSSSVVVVGVDVGAMTGVAVAVGDVTGATTWRWSTQDEPGLAVDALRIALGGKAADLLVIEAPFTVSREQMMEGRFKVTPTTLFAMGESSGYMKRALEPLSASHVVTWRPAASTWRSVLGLAGGRREEVNERVHRWAEATLGYDVRTRRGLPAYDEANAVGMAHAGLHVARSIMWRKP